MSSMRLKEQDDFIAFINELASGYGCMHKAFSIVSDLAYEMHHRPDDSVLKSLLPSMSKQFLPIDYIRAFKEYDVIERLSMRRFVPPSFRETRTIINHATIHSMATHLKLLTLDADCTIYSDGGTLAPGDQIIHSLVKIMRMGINVAIVTAASYPGEPWKYEQRLAGLLSSLAFAVNAGAPKEIADRFWVMGGQCNYLLKCRIDVSKSHPNAIYGEARVFLEEVPSELWKPHRGERWCEKAVKDMLDTAEKTLRETSEKFNLDVLIIRKERATGLIARNATTHVKYEILEEVALCVQEAIQESGSTVPYCAFNGGHDVFVDVGHKALGIRALQGMLGVEPHETAHAGDRFTATGNDLRAREVALTLWVANPSETEDLLELLLEDLNSGDKSSPASREIMKFTEEEIAYMRSIATRAMTIGQPLATPKEPRFAVSGTPLAEHEDPAPGLKLVATNFEGVTSPSEVPPRTPRTPSRSSSTKAGISGKMAVGGDIDSGTIAGERKDKFDQSSTDQTAGVLCKIGTPVFSPATVAADARMDALMLDGPERQDSANFSVLSFQDQPEDDLDESTGRLSLESENISNAMFKSASFPDFTTMEKIRSLMAKEGNMDTGGVEACIDDSSSVSKAYGGVSFKPAGDMPSRASAGVGARGDRKSVV